MVLGRGCCQKWSKGQKERLLLYHAVNVHYFAEKAKDLLNKPTLFAQVRSIAPKVRIAVKD